jgi:lipoprotein NlpI
MKRFLFLVALGTVSLGWCADERQLYRQGETAFFAGKMAEALVAWDAKIAAAPDRRPHHWQRGIALYYAQKYTEGRAQFEAHQKVNPEDVENAVWHFLCVAKLENIAAARKVYIPITHDARVPMAEIHALFAGSGSEAAVMAAAEKTPRPGTTLDGQRAYAHLYLGLYAEAQGENKKCLAHLREAVARFPEDNYMGRVARVHLRLRES